jgi:type IV pilus assembly protein PilC
MPRLPSKTLITLCRSLHHQLAAGVNLVELFRRLARKPADALQPAAARIAAVLETGADFSTALAAAGVDWPPLFLSLVAVGEQSGMLPEVFGTLEQYYVREQSLRREFLSRITWPMLQLIAAVLVLALLIWIRGALLPPLKPGGAAYDPLGLGLAGASGAMIFLAAVAAFAGMLSGGVLLVKRLLRAGPGIDRLLLRVPAVGPCLRALAVARFCLALRLTTATGMPLRKALALSFTATGNAAFLERGVRADKSVRGGKELTAALARTKLFPQEFCDILQVGEESGRLDEVLRQQANYYDAEAGRRLTALTAVVGYGIWVAIGIVLIVVILRMFTSYTALLTSAGA